tara:strand:- start:316 stop:531 length:216 start_codon:yes stop_codon:yes gene_type:complete
MTQVPFAVLLGFLFNLYLQGVLLLRHNVTQQYEVSIKNFAIWSALEAHLRSRQARRLGKVCDLSLLWLRFC